MQPLEDSMELPCCSLSMRCLFSRSVTSSFVLSESGYPPWPHPSRTSGSVGIFTSFPSETTSSPGAVTGSCFVLFHPSFYRAWHACIANMHLPNNDPWFCLFDHPCAWLGSWVRYSSGDSVLITHTYFYGGQAGAEERIKTWDQTRWISNPGSAAA